MAADVELIEAVRAALRGAAQPELARPMQAYMKSATPFLGVRVPTMRTLTRAEAKLRPFTISADLIDTVLRLWREADYREERYAESRCSTHLPRGGSGIRPSCRRWRN